MRRPATILLALVAFLAVTEHANASPPYCGKGIRYSALSYARYDGASLVKRGDYRMATRGHLSTRLRYYDCTPRR